MLPGRLQECEALSQVSSSVSILPKIHQQTIQIILQSSITASHFFARLLFGVKKKHPKHFQNKRIKEIIDAQGHHFTSYLSGRLCSGVERKEDFLAHVSVSRYLLLEST